MRYEPAGEGPPKHFYALLSSIWWPVHLIFFFFSAFFALWNLIQILSSFNSVAFQLIQFDPIQSNFTTKPLGGVVPDSFPQSIHKDKETTKKKRKKNPSDSDTIWASHWSPLLFSFAGFNWIQSSCRFIGSQTQLPAMPKQSWSIIIWISNLIGMKSRPSARIL